MAAAKKKRKTLPKDFEQQLKSADLAALQRVFETCEIDARDKFRYSQQTALLMPTCPDALARWLVAQGADVKAVDFYECNALHIAARYRRDLALLIKLGCDIEARNHSGDTPLHAAADAKNLSAVECLLAVGANVNVTNGEGLTPLEQALRRCMNIDIQRMVLVARVLLAAGATRTSVMNDFVQKIGKNFEFHRLGFAKDSVEATSAALVELCEIFSVNPSPRRLMHDGKSRITMNEGTWQQQHDDLWQFLIPSSGAALTVQGEVIRISGRIADEILTNGGGNWDTDYTQMARAFIKFVRSEQPLDEVDVQGVEKIVEDIIKKRGGVYDNSHERLVELAVEWVRRNPQPFRLGKVAYER